MEKENIYLCQEEENLRKKMRKTFGEGIFFSSEEKEMETDKRGNFLEKENVMMTDTHTVILKMGLELWTQNSQ